ncbi:MAG: SDR family NAD(P)-dependent oxidoreductase [Verrucomicrobiota bacterium]
MLAQDDEGHIVNTSSGNGGVSPLPSTPQYAATKAAVASVRTQINTAEFRRMVKEKRTVRRYRGQARTRNSKKLKTNTTPVMIYQKC